MHSVYQRINNLSAFLSTCLFTLAALITATTFILQPTSEVVSKGNSLSVEHGLITSRRVGYYGRVHDTVDLNFNITADLSPIFHWNAKQLFVYITADYDHSSEAKGGRKIIDNRVVVWDRIIRDKESAKLNLVNQRPKYPLRDYSKSWSNALPATYTLHYDVMPYVGILTSGTAGQTTNPVNFPTKKNKAKTW
ncbi:hypothetical protein FS837_002701 [Tulasnella sp. UAMH 9824]|nr:hypothetical protein FS837_002701 [Tulasnella sp. UAMH 9824]